MNWGLYGRMDAADWHIYYHPSLVVSSKPQQALWEKRPVRDMHVDMADRDYQRCVHLSTDRFSSVGGGGGRTPLPS